VFGYLMKRRFASGSFIFRLLGCINPGMLRTHLSRKESAGLLIVPGILLLRYYIADGVRAPVQSPINQINF
jgi:predicted helicase